jgi:hypothetical protein
MKVDQKGTTTIIRNTQYKTAEFCAKFNNEYNSFKNSNLILDLSMDKDIAMTDVKLFSAIIKSHKKNKKSLILVSDSVNFNKVPSTITLVPSIQEAHDIIEMEEIERDLGF